MKFVWACDGCHKPIPDKQGHICCDWVEAMKRERNWAERKREKHAEATANGAGTNWLAGEPMDPTAGSPLVVWSGAELLTMPGPVSWEVWHQRCDPHPDRNDYWFAVERCRALEDLLEWNAHLNEKRWVRHTDWCRFIQRRLVPRDAAR